jgi:hypothetical protein
MSKGAPSIKELLSHLELEGLITQQDLERITAISRSLKGERRILSTYEFFQASVHGWLPFS